MYFNNMKYISRFLFMQAFFPFFVEEKLIFVICSNIHKSKLNVF